MSGANMSGANMVRADLRWANLSEANMSEANMSFTDLSEANMSKANLSMANLECAALEGANLDAAILIKAILSESDISGASINNANLSRWIIKDIICTHIKWMGKLLEFKGGEFEKAFTTIENTIEIILNLPFSELGYHTGRVIEKAINNKYGGGALLFRGQEAISDTDTKFQFISFGNEKQLQEIKAKIDKIPGEIEKRVIQKLEGQKVKDEDRRLLNFKNEIDIPLTRGLVKLNTKELTRRLNEHYMTMSPALQQIFMAVQSAIQ
jgi:hypothetical protein